MDLAATMHPPPSEADTAYIRAGFVTLTDVCIERGTSPDFALSEIAAGRLPGPAYILGRDYMVGADHFELLDQVGSMKELESAFKARFVAASRRCPLAGDADETWADYLSGVLAVCLRVVTPEAIARKEHLVAVIDAAIAAPTPTEASWCRRLHVSVTGLDALCRDFAHLDHERFGRATSRERCVTSVRRAHPAIFG